MDTTQTNATPPAVDAAARERQSAAGGDAIRVEGLRKTYGEKVAVKGVSFAVRRGEVFALLGPNGAGKTSTIEILEGYRACDGGVVDVLDMHPRRDAEHLKPRVGVMLQQDGLYPSLRAGEVLDLFARFFAHPEDPGALLDLVGLRESAGVRCRQLSGGQKRRLALLFLDEPTTGMDPQARRATWDIIRALRERGATVLLTTHLMDEAERLADRIAIMDDGELIALDTPAGLTRGQSTTTTEVHVTLGAEIEIAALSALPTARAARRDASGKYTVETGDARALLVELTALLRDRGLDVSELRVGRSSLEDVFLRLTGKEMRE